MRSVLTGRHSHRTTRMLANATRLEAVHRALKGTPGGVAAIAVELGTSIGTVASWIDWWTRRISPWDGPLEQWEIDLGYEEESVGDHGDRRVVHRGKGVARQPNDIALEELLKLFTMVPTQKRDRLENTYQKLDDAQRAAIGPAYDLYLQASDAMDSVRRMMKEALEIATREVREAGAAA